MRMHTIPQNVSAYEDRIVGSLIGKQFIYLAIGGVIVIALVTTPIGPLLIRISLAVVIALFAAALALLRLNDRPFDEIFSGYMIAIFGPTEWAWGKEPAIPAQLEGILSLGEELKIPTKTTSLKDTQVQKRRQAQHYQRLLSHQQRTNLDDSEVQFIDQLDFSANVPQKVFTITKDSSAAPPMLTPENYQQPRVTSSNKVAKQNFTVQGSLTPLAGVGTNRLTYIAADNNLTIAKPHMQPQPNRSLSRRANLTLPIKGEIQLNISQATQDNLNQIIAQQQARPSQFSQTSAAQAGQSLAQHDITNQTPSTFTMNQSPDLPQSNNQSTTNQPQGEYEATFGTTDRQYYPVNQSPTDQSTDNSQLAEASSSNNASPSSATSSNGVNSAEAASIESALTDLQQQAQQIDTPNQLSPTGSLAKFDKFSTSQNQTPPTIDPNLANLPIDQPLNNASDQSSYTPLPVNPVLNPDLIASQTSQPQTSPAVSNPTLPVDNQATKIVQQAPTLASKQLVLTQEANIINGRVIDAQGQSVPGVIIVVKSEQGEAKRALKTNKLGQFVVTTPLSNGIYTVEVDKKGFNFDIIQVQLTGMVLPAIEIHAK